MNHLNSKVLGLATIALMSLMLLLQLSSQDEMTESELLLPELALNMTGMKKSVRKKEHYQGQPHCTGIASMSFN